MPLAILDQCGSFHKACEVPSLLTPRSFTNLFRTLAPEIRTFRVLAEAHERFIALSKLAMEGLPESWTADQDPFNGLLLETGKLRTRFITETIPALFAYDWNEAFPAFDPLPRLEEAKRVFWLPFEVYTERMLSWKLGRKIKTFFSATTA
ncbi:hypothetical protein HDU98_006520 [Podochytrium sp. JEL0797]|nr:hypothetical protein HDU98_006520 [Podochytrium sp. JEL0797]